MKMKNIAAGLLLILTCGYSSVVSAAEIQTVQLTKENQLVYTKDKTELAGAFEHTSFRWRSAMIPEGYLCWMQMPVDMRKMWQVPKV